MTELQVLEYRRKIEDPDYINMAINTIASHKLADKLTETTIAIEKNMFFCERLSSIMKQQNITSKQLAYKTGVSKGTIDCYRNNRKHLPRIDTAVAIAQALGISIDYLLTGKNENNLYFEKRIREMKQAINNAIEILKKSRGIR